MTPRASARGASKKARLNLARQLLQGGNGGIARDDSDDELGFDDIPWEWVYPQSASLLSPVAGNLNPSQTPTKKRKREDNVSSEDKDAQPIGARFGKFDCHVGDCLLLRAEGQKVSWVGLATEFGMHDDQMSVKIMWFSNHSEIRNRTKKRTDFLLNELYITPSYDWNPIESISGKADVHSDHTYKTTYPNGVGKNSKKAGKVFICRRAVDLRPANYSEEFIWEDVFKGHNTDMEEFTSWVKQATSSRKRRVMDDQFDEISEEDEEFEDDAEDEGGAPRTPRKKKRRTVARTPKSNKGTPRKFMTPSNRKIKAKKALTFTPLSMRIISPATHLSSPYQIARNRLHVSSVPDTLPCREKEFSTVYSHLHDAISTGSGTCIYISGTPGTGKTATVREVITQLHYEVQEETLEDFIFLEVNGMKIADPHQSYSLLWEAIQGEAEGAPARVAPGHALTLLEREFSTPSPRRVPVVVLMDELDQLVTKNQSVMYNFFNWPAMAHSRLIVLAVANTMDLPERTLSNKISSRLGLTRITFPGYTHDQLMKIIQSRLEGVPNKIVEPDAIQFASRKVAAVSGDARRALDICRRAVEMVEQTSKEGGSSGGPSIPGTPSKSGRHKAAGGGNPSASSSGKVTIQVIIKAINEATSSPLQMYLRHLPLVAKVFLAALLSRMRRSGVSENLMADVIEDAERMVRMSMKPEAVEALLGKDKYGSAREAGGVVTATPRKRGYSKPGDGEAARVRGLVMAAVGLAEGGLLGLEISRRGERAGRVRLNVGEEEVKAALKDDVEVAGMGFS